MAVGAVVAVGALIAGGVAIGRATFDVTASPEYQEMRDLRDQVRENLNEVQGDLNAAEEEVAQYDAISSELAAEADNLEARAAELDTREADLKAREDAVTVVEEQVEATSIDQGVWTVGVDVEPGTYRATDVSGDCYWAILESGTNGSEIIDNDIPGGGNPTVTLSEGQDFETSRCGVWRKQ